MSIRRQRYTEVTPRTSESSTLVSAVIVVIVITTYESPSSIE